MKVFKEGCEGKFNVEGKDLEFKKGFAECTPEQAEVLCGDVFGAKMVEEKKVEPKPEPKPELDPEPKLEAEKEEKSKGKKKNK